SIPASGAIMASSAGGAARTGCGNPASLGTINRDLRGCRLYDSIEPLFRWGCDFDSGRSYDAGYAPAVASAPADLVARRRAALLDGRGRREHVEVRAPARPHLRCPRALSQALQGD